LFVERAAATLPSFSLDPTNVAAVVEICRRLDGIPLALELAAARVNVLSVQEIAQGLGDRFRLLTGGRRTAVPRQQTLQALIDWSWDLLSEPDRRLLRRLSVFAGGWTLAAATAVTSEGILAGGAAPANASDGNARLATLDGLSRLVDRSLVVVDHEGPTRYRMLETIRQYARDQLVRSGEVAELGAAHLAFFRELALTAEPALRGRDMIPWLDRLDVESDNLRSALDWAFEADPGAALQLCLSLTNYWATRSVGSESVEWLGRAVAVARTMALDTTSPSSRERSILAARALAAAAVTWSLWVSGGPALGWAEEALAVARQTSDPLALSSALSAVAMASVFSGRAWSPRELLDELVPLLEQIGDWWQLATMEAGLAIGDMDGDPVQAEARLARATEAARRSENPAAIAFTARARSRVAGDRGRLEEARRWFLEAMERYREIGDRRQVLGARSDLAHAIRRHASIDEAEAEYRQTIQEWRRLGNRGAIANQLEAFAFVALARRNGVRAARLLGAAEALREVAESPLLAMERTEYDAEVARLREEPDQVALRSAWAEGREMTADEAVAFALSG
jgi:tetratricopeptide (TPR) repeat protein